MSDDDKSMDVQLICNQRVVNYSTLQFMNPIFFSVPWDDSIDIIALYPVKNSRDEPYRPYCPLLTSARMSTGPMSTR